MRLVAVITLALGLTPASALNRFRRDQISITDDLDVPGESPLKYCDANRKDDLVSIEKVDLLPNPPEAYVQIQR